MRRHPRSAAGDWAGRWIARSCGACADLHPEAELQEVLLPPGSWLSRYLAARGFVAITIGRRVFVRVPLTDALYRHELEHVRQWARWGAIFPVAYGLASLASRLRGAGWYRGNRFEIAARAAEAERGRRGGGDGGAGAAG